MWVQLGGNLDNSNLSIAQELTGIQGDLKRFLEAYCTLSDHCGPLSMEQEKWRQTN